MNDRLRDPGLAHGQTVILWIWLALISASSGAVAVAVIAYRRDTDTAMLGVAIAQPGWPKPAAPDSGPAVGERAPDFELVNVRSALPVRLSACLTRPVVLFFGTYS